MEMTIAWFPMIKLLLTAVMIYIGYYFYKKGKMKTSAFYAIALIVFWSLSPIKYDGTNSTQHKLQSVKAKTIQYRNVDATIVETKKLTFDERMAAEDARSKAANKKVHDEIVK